MKNLIFILALIFLALFSCRNSDDDVQNIDQVINLYLKDTSGKDLLNPKISGSYTSVSLYDLGDVYDQVVISNFSLKKNADTVTYIDYVSGAKKNLIDSTSATQKKYKSEFIVKLSKVVNKVTVSDLDTVKIEYTWTPTLFSISKIYYNGIQKTSTKIGSANTVSIVK